MAGDKKQSTAMKENREIILGNKTGNWGDRPNKEILKDATILPAVVTNCEDVTTKVLRQGTQMAETAFSVFDAAYRKMVTREYETEEMVRSHISKMKDKAGQIADALGKIEKLTGPDFETKLQRLERFANAVDTLDRLNKTGKLAEVAASLSKLN